jgi:hypothetical protein
MKRRIPNILAAVSLVLALAVAGLWVRSYWFSNGFLYKNVHQDGPDTWRLESRIRGLSEGVLFILRDWGSTSDFKLVVKDADRWTWDNHKRLSGVGIRPGSKLGFRFINAPTTSRIEIPVYAIFLATLIMPAVWSVRKIRSVSRNPYACPSCGYDLRASKDECPECGTKIAAT